MVRTAIAAVFASVLLAWTPGALLAQGPEEPCPVCGYPLPWDARVCSNCGTTFEIDPGPPEPKVKPDEPDRPEPDKPKPPAPKKKPGGGGRTRPVTPDDLGKPPPPPKEYDEALEYGYVLLRVEDTQFVPEQTYRITAGVDHDSGHHLSAIGRYHGKTDVTNSVLWGRLEYGLYDYALVHLTVPFQSVSVDPEVKDELVSGQGPGDVSFGLRWGFLHAPDVTAGIDVGVPTGEELEGRGRASNTVRAVAIYADHFPEFSIAWNLGAVVGNVEREFSATSSDPAQVRTIIERTLQAGVAVQRSMGTWVLFAEMYAEYEDFGFRTWGDNQQFENLLLYGGPGLRWRMGGGQHVTLGALAGMSSQSQDFSFHLRIAFEF